MPLSALQQNVYDHTGFNSADTVAVRRILSNMNTAHRQIMTAKGMSRLRRSTVTFASVASSPYAVLPQSVSRILFIADRTNNTFIDIFETLSSMRQSDPGLLFTSGVPTAALIDNLAAAVKLEPSAAAEVFFKSDDAADGVTKKMFIQGLITGYEQRVASVAMNGVTAVSFSAAITSWVSITKIFLALAAGGATTAAGNITIHQTSGLGTELARILPGQTNTRYSRIQLYPVPSAVVTYHADVELDIINMAEAGDEPLIPSDFHWLLESAAIIREWTRKEKPALAKEEERRYLNGVAELRSYVRALVASEAVEGGQYSQLGAMYPAGT